MWLNISGHKVSKVKGMGRLLVAHPSTPPACLGDTDFYKVDVNLPFFSLFMVTVNYDHK